MRAWLFGIVCAAAPTAAFAAWPVSAEDRWFNVQFNGRPVGFAHESWTPRGDGGWQHVARVEIELGGCLPPVRYWTEVETEAGADGAVVSVVWAEQNGVTKRIDVDDGLARREVRWPGMEPVVEARAVPPECLRAAYLVDRHLQERSFEGEAKICTLDLNAAKMVVHHGARVAGAARVDLGHQTVWTSVVEMRSLDTGRLLSRRWVDADGRVVYRIDAALGRSSEMILRDGPPPAGYAPPVDMFGRIGIPAPIGRGDPRRWRSATWVVSGPVADVAALPVGPGQRVVQLEPGRSQVSVRVDAEADAEPAGWMRSWLERSERIDGDDPAVRALVERALERAPADAAVEAERMRVFVHDFLKEGAPEATRRTSGEIARTARGDATAHATLLVAMLRARQIPARVAVGLVGLAEDGGQFVRHTWAQAWIEGVNGGGRWVDLDAAWGSRLAFDAAHIRLGVSATGEVEREGPLSLLWPWPGEVRVERARRAAR
jgi:hypothetical protein